MFDVKLWVDDERPPPEGWIRAKDVESARSMLRWEPVSEISLDHDLGDGPTGYEIVKMLEEWWQDGGQWRARVPSVILCHSANPAGRARIEQVIARIKKWRSELDNPDSAA